MKRISKLWLLSALVWIGSFGALVGLELRRPAVPGRIDWLFVLLLSTAFTVTVTAVARRIVLRPSPSRQAALAALFATGAPGAVVVMREGSPEVIATVQSRDEYLALLSAGKLPAKHELYTAEDF